MRKFFAVAGIALLALAGCAAIPSSGSVHEGENISTADDGVPFNYLPKAPADGMDQQQILQGFIDAASSPKNDYAIARLYLTSQFSSTWKPEQNVIVDAGTGRSYAKTGDDSIQLALQPVATIDASGVYHEVSASAPVTLQFRFIRTPEGWRISKAPNGTVLDEPTFADVFTSHAVYFFDPTFHYLVPDLRWFISGRSTPTSIVKTLLAGPAEWLGGHAIVSAFPDGTQLSADSVPVESFRAEVDLNVEANQADSTTLSRMKTQLSRSLIGVTGVSSVAISIEGTEVNVPDLSTETAPLVNPQVDSRPLVYKSGRFGMLSGKEIVELPVSAQVEKLKPAGATVSASRRQAAVLAAGGAYSVSPTSSKLVDSRAKLIPPSLDPFGYVWSVPEDAPGKLIAFSPEGRANPISTSWPEATAIDSLAVSRDGTRLVALLGAGSRTRFVAAAIIRDEKNVPKQLGAPISLAHGDGDPVAAAWVDELTVVGLTSDGAGSSTVAVQVLGGKSTELSAPNGAAMIAGGGSVTQYWLLTSSGSVQGGRGTGWQETANGVGMLGTQLGTPG